MAATQKPVAEHSGSLLGGLLTGLAINTLPAWAAWKLLESPRRETVLQSDFNTWLIVVAAAAGATLIGILFTLRARRRFALGLALGIPLAAAAVIVGMLVDFVGSGGSLGG